MNTQECSKQFYISFQPVTMNDGTTFINTESDSPAWVQNVIRKSHLGHLPNSYYYSTIYHIAGLLYDTVIDNPDLPLSTMADIAREQLEPDIYTSDLAGWLGAFDDHIGYLDDAIKEGGFTDGWELLANAQMHWKMDILDSVVNALQAVIDSK